MTSQLNPVLLVHGIQDTQAKFRALQSHLKKGGWQVHALDLQPNDGRAPLETLAQQVATYVDRHFDPQQKIDLVGFSMGGLVSRYYLQRLGGVERVQRYVSISTPHGGTIWGFALPWAGVRQMCPGSAFLGDLNGDYLVQLAPLQVTVIWTPYDLMIIPAHSCRLGLGQEIVLPVPVHSWMVGDRRTLAQVERSLARPVAVLP